MGDENGNNVSISGTNGTITATGDITTANRINAANGGKLADIDVTGNKLSNGNSSITLDGTNVKVNDKVTVDKDGKISGVAKGDISNTSTDAVMVANFMILIPILLMLKTKSSATATALTNWATV